MNKLIAKVTNQKNANGLSKIEAICCGSTFRLIMFEEEAIDRIGQDVHLIIKESEIAISKIESPTISISNQIPCKICEIKRGEILSEIILLFDTETLSSFITTDSLERLLLEKNAPVYALIKANEIYLESFSD